MEYTALFAGVIGAIFLAGAGYWKAYGSNGEPFDPVKFLTTVTLGAIVGAVMGLMGMPFTEENFLTQVAIFGFLTGIIETVWKAVFRGADSPALEEVGTAWLVRINLNPEVAHLPEEKRYQMVSPTGKVYSGDRNMVVYLATSQDRAARAWRARYK